MEYLINLFRELFSTEPDPVYMCKVYQDKGCSHVDGFLCNLDACEERIEYEESLKK